MADPDEHLLSPNERRLLNQQKRDLQGQRPVDDSAASTGGKMRVDPAKIPVAIKGLEEALRRVEAIGLRARQLARIEPPFSDPYSRAAVQAISERANQSSGAHGKANADYQDALKAAIANLTAMYQGYLNAEDKNRGIGGKRQ